MMKYLKVWTSFLKVIEPLSDDEKGRLFVLMRKYSDSNEEPAEIAGNERYTWPAAKQMIDLMFEENARLSRNGKKGGRPVENQLEPTETNENQLEPTESQKEKKRKEKEIKETIKRFTPPTLQEVESYCRERRNTVNAQRFIDFYESKGWKVGNQPMKDWRACVRTWEQREGVKKVVAQDFQ